MNLPDKIITQIFRSPKEEGMYLYVKKDEGLSTPQPAMVLVLTPEKKLARASAEKVIESLESRGYYLQLPPLDELDSDMLKLRTHNSKLAGH
jgi:uncharacterized protein YcgL (UPF0745 family)